jgi:[ribosomal protein S5]-alanine N-acetyltransferase
MDGVALVTLAPEHVDRLAAVRVANAQDIRVSSARRTAAIFTANDVARSLEHRIDEAAADLHPFVIIKDGIVVGDLNLSQIVRGPEESANVGVLVDRAVRGQGIASAAIALACRLAFGELALHRLQAGIQPANVASQKAFLRNGFEQIGLAKGYLFVDGAWRDHVLYQKLA